MNYRPITLAAVAFALAAILTLLVALDVAHAGDPAQTSGPHAVLLLPGYEVHVGVPSDLAAWSPSGARLVESYGPWAAKLRSGRFYNVAYEHVNGDVISYGTKPVVLMWWTEGKGR